MSVTKFIRDLLTWEYGLHRRHLVLALAGCVGWADLYVTQIQGSVPPLLALAAFVAPLAVIGALLRASPGEVKTLASYAVLAWFVLAGIPFLLHGELAPATPYTTFAQTTVLGLVFMSATAVAMLAVAEAILVLLAFYALPVPGGPGQGGTSPEERVLSEAEYEEFDPIEDQLPVGVQQCPGSYSRRPMVPSLVSTSLDTGLRPIEVERAKTYWVDAPNEVLRIPTEESSKNTDNWIVGIQSRTAEMLQRWLEEREKLPDVR